MGIQVRVETKDLPEAFVQEIRTKEVLRGDCSIYDSSWEYPCGCNGSGCYTTRKELWVNFPKSGWMVSYLDDALVFDNKFANDQFVEELEEHQVEYVRG